MKVKKKEGFDIRRIGKIDRLIHEPSRIVIMANLFATTKVEFVSLLQQTGLSKGNLSSHISRLEAGGYVKVKKVFTGKVPRTHLNLSRSGRNAFLAYKRLMQNILNVLPDK